MDTDSSSSQDDLEVPVFCRSVGQSAQSLGGRRLGDGVGSMKRVQQPISAPPSSVKRVALSQLSGFKSAARSGHENEEDGGGGVTPSATPFRGHNCGQLLCAAPPSSAKRIALGPLNGARSDVTTPDAHALRGHDVSCSLLCDEGSSDPSQANGNQPSPSPALGQRSSQRLDAGMEALRGVATKGQIKHVYCKAAVEKRTGDVHGLPDLLVQVLRSSNQFPLYSHQADACQRVFNGSNVVVATPTASGKSLVFYIPVLEALLSSQGDARALFLFPLKALARDQLNKMKGYMEKMRNAAEAGAAADVKMAKAVNALDKAEAHIYDGDTPVTERPTIRKKARIIMTNPDMLHCAMLPSHSLWGPFLRNLRFIVIDEAHHYRGLFGSHFALVLRRLLRLCWTVYGSEPQVIAASATIGNPARHVQCLTSLPVEACDESGAPCGEKRVLMWQPPMESGAEGEEEAMRSTYLETADILADLVKAGLQTLAFVPARKLTEIISKYTMSRLMKKKSTKELAKMVESYRAGYSAAERKLIEERLAAGQLRGLVATNALELGIDVGELDVTLHFGVPLHMHELWQQAGRAGRRNAASLAVVVANDSPMDHYYMANPQEYFHRGCEEALIDTDNAGIVKFHLMFAAHESPLTPADVRIFGPSFKDGVNSLLASQFCRQCSASRCFRPHQPLPTSTGIRGNISNDAYKIICGADGAVIEEVDGNKVDSVAHVGAILLHRQDAFIVERLDRASLQVYVAKFTENQFTKPKEKVALSIAGVSAQKRLGGAVVGWGDVSVRHHVVGYTRYNLYTRKVLNERMLPKEDYPPTTLQTKALWITVPMDIAAKLEKNGFDILQALEAIKKLTLLKVPCHTLCDTGDIKGITAVAHEDTELPSVFIYDFYEGGIGVVGKAYERMLTSDFMSEMLAIVSSCPCSKGCPGCVLPSLYERSSTDGSGSSAKDACRMLLEGLLCTWMAPAGGGYAAIAAAKNNKAPNCENNIKQPRPPDDNGWRDPSHETTGC